MGLLFSSSTALADGGARVVLLGPSERDPTVVRLRRELELLGLEVDFVPDAGAPRRPLADVARERHAPAALAVESSPPAVLLWTEPSRAPDAAPGQEMRLDQGAAEPRMLVLRAVELVRERLLPAPPPTDAGPEAARPAGVAEAPASPTSSTSAATTGPAVVPPAVATSELARARGPSMFAGPAVLASPGGVAATPHVWLGARWAPLARLDLELLAFLPTTAATVTAPEGSMSLRAGALAAGMAVRLTEPASTLFVTAGAGLGVILTAFEGEARAPWQSASGLRAGMLPYLRAGGGYWLVPWLALRADVMTGFALPQPTLSIAGKRVAVFGEPTAVFAAGLEVRP
jgi:hypothetical protein